MSALDPGPRPGDAELRREVLRLRFAVSRLRVQDAVAELQGGARRSGPVRAMYWAMSPLARRVAVIAAAAALLAGLWRFGWRRPASWLAEGLSLWQLAQPLVGSLRHGWRRDAVQAAAQDAAEAAGVRPAQAA